VNKFIENVIAGAKKSNLKHPPSFEVACLVSLAMTDLLFAQNKINLKKEV
jgi:hypothetical protein